MMLNNDYQKEDSQDALRMFLRKLGLKSVETDFEYSLSRMMRQIKFNHGRPDEMLMDPISYKNLNKIFGK